MFSQLTAVVDDSESLARYLNQSSHFHLMTRSVKPRAFEPPHDLHLSVFRIDGLTMNDVWILGQTKVIDRMPEPRTLYGMARIKAGRVRDLHLSIYADDDPPRHACIEEWPDEKSARKLKAQELAASAELVLRS